MTAITGARPRRSLLGLLGAVLHAHAQARGARGSRLAAAIRDHAMTFAAMGLIDAGMFRWSPIAGFVVTGLSLLLIDAKIQD